MSWRRRCGLGGMAAWVSAGAMKQHKENLSKRTQQFSKEKAGSTEQCCFSDFITCFYFPRQSSQMIMSFASAFKEIQWQKKYTLTGDQCIQKTHHAAKLCNDAEVPEFVSESLPPEEIWLPIELAEDRQQNISHTLLGKSKVKLLTERAALCF